MKHVAAIQLHLEPIPPNPLKYLMISRHASSYLVTALAALAGCATVGPQEEERVASICPPDLTPACTTYMGKPLRCTCNSRDGLRQIFEPGSAGPPAH